MMSQIMWLVMYVVSTLYTFTWDVLQDWGLGYPAYGFLRKKRLFSNPSVSEKRHALICLLMTFAHACSLSDAYDLVRNILVPIAGPVPSFCELKQTSRLLRRFGVRALTVTSRKSLV